MTESQQGTVERTVTKGQKAPESPKDRGPFCTCCQPPNKLQPRPDLGRMADGSAKYALCIRAKPYVVYVNRGDGIYERKDDLRLSDDGSQIIGPDGKPVVTSQSRIRQALGTRDAGGERPATGERVDLSQDEFYLP